MADQPQSIDDIKKNPKMMAAYLAFAKRRQILDQVLFYLDKGNAQGIYPKYIDPNSPNSANINDATITAAKALADKGDWGNPGWPKIITDGKREVQKTLEPPGEFCASDEYKNFIKTEKMGDPTKAAKLLGISDVKKLKLAMEAQVTGDKIQAKKLFEEILKKEQMKEKYENIVKSLERAGLV